MHRQTPFTQPVILKGRLIQLEPLSLEHVAGLAAVGLDPEIWQFMLYGEMKNEADIRRWVEDLLARQAAGSDLPFAVRMRASGEIAGATRYLNIDPDHRHVEVGGTWYGKHYQRTGVNTEAKYLLFRHAFETLGCIRVQIKTDSRNLRSQAAIVRIGAVREGVMRKHMILPDGQIRDSVYYSIIDDEWAQVKQRLERMMNRVSDQESGSQLLDGTA
jgi:RimJ/RimL family protein N-acetyltransferase